MTVPSASEAPELYRAIFAIDARGRQVLEHLEHRFCSRATVVTQGGIDAILQTYERAAQRAVLDHIHAQIARAEGDNQRETPLAKTGEDR